ncbi:FAD synthetase [Apiospora kogelbergensis]|uniref:FAD synthetase n=1 Tax=Apiospora kogelbergensis TaxID=1337665 RepID=UPI003130BD26
MSKTTKTTLPPTTTTTTTTQRTVAHGRRGRHEAALPAAGGKLDKFLDTPTADKVLQGVQAQVRIAQAVIEDALKRYRPDELLIAYNGGKDCLVLLVLILASLPTHFPFQHPPPASDSASDSSRQNHSNATRTAQSSNSLASRFPHALQALYIRPPRPFAEVDAFVAETTATYHLDLSTSDQPMKAALAEYLVERPRVKAVFVGTRRTDPHGAALSFFDETDPDWPRFMRVHPRHRLALPGSLGSLEIPYCPLYDMGYTSLGGTDDTHPNPALKRGDDNTKEEKETSSGFRPAYELMDDDEERLGRDR